MDNVCATIQKQKRPRAQIFFIPVQTRVYTDSRPDKPYAGQIGYISPRAEFTPKNVETSELRTSLVYRLRVVVNHPDEGLRQGMPVTVKVTLPPARVGGAQ